jgi:hypothetical protein
VKFFAAALALTLFLVGPARAQFSLPESMPKLPKGEYICNKGGTVCLINREDLNGLEHEVDVQSTVSQLLEQQVKVQRDYIARLEAKVNVCRPPARLQVLPAERKS